MRTLPLGSHAMSDSTLTPPAQYFERGEVDKAKNHVDSIFYQLANPTVYDHLSHFATNAYYQGTKGNTALQIVYLDSGIALIQAYLPDKGLSIELSNFLTGRAGANFNRNNFQASYTDFFAAGEMARKNADSCSTMRVFYSIAMILYKQQQYANAARYFLQTLDYSRNCDPLVYRNNKTQELLDNIGLCYTKIKRYDSAMYFYRRAQDLVLKNRYLLAVDSANSIGRYRAALQVITGNIAKVYLGTGQVDSAIALYKQAISYHADLHDMQLSMIQLADIYVSRNDIPLLQQLLVRLGNSIDSFPAPDLGMDHDRLRYLFHKKTGNPETALSYFTQYVQKKDANEKQQDKLASLDISNEIQRKAQELEIQLLQKNNELNKTYLWVFVSLSCMAIIILSLIYASYRTSRRNVAKLTELNEAITRTNQEKDKILRMVAHDLRNPIGAIASLSGLILQAPLNKEEILDLVGKIQGVSANSIELINELLPVHASPAGSLKKRRTDMVRLLNNMAELMQFRATEKKQRIALQLPQTPVYCTVNEIKIERVINNLLGNAIKFSPVGGEVVLRLAVQEKNITVSVSDNGIGIDTTELEHIFDEFTSLKRKGTSGETSFGLGLSISRQIVEEEGGIIWAESQKNSGSTFYVRLNRS
ncbi:sensor histidine kinase [Sediminibacterium sp. WSJ-3]|nr:sensor histidine kinase [Sediminibacterium soli]